MAKRRHLAMQKRTKGFLDRQQPRMSQAEFEQTLQDGNGIFWDYDPISGEVRPYDEETVVKRLSAHLNGSR